MRVHILKVYAACQMKIATKHIRIISSYILISSIIERKEIVMVSYRDSSTTRYQSINTKKIFRTSVHIHTNHHTSITSSSVAYYRLFLGITTECYPFLPNEEWVIHKWIMLSTIVCHSCTQCLLTQNNIQCTRNSMQSKASKHWIQAQEDLTVLIFHSLHRPRVQLLRID